MLKETTIGTTEEAKHEAIQALLNEIAAEAAEIDEPHIEAEDRVFDIFSNEAMHDGAEWTHDLEEIDQDVYPVGWTDEEIDAHAADHDTKKVDWMGMEAMYMGNDNWDLPF